MRQGGQRAFPNHPGQRQRRRADTQRREGPFHHRGWDGVPRLPVRRGAALERGRLLWHEKGSPTTTAPGFPSMKWRPWPGCCSRRFKPFSRVRKGRGSLPSGKHSGARNKRNRHGTGGNIFNDIPPLFFVIACFIIWFS